MMKKYVLQIVGLLILMMIVVIFSLNYMRGTTAFGVTSFFPRDNRQQSVEAGVIRQTRLTYEEAKDARTDFSQSPCLAIELTEGYALDVVHEPRTEADNLNQCESYRNGTVAGLVEILPDGTIVTITP